MTRRSKPPIAIYSALGDATRCRIVEILLAGPMPVHTLANDFSISRPAISRHLRVLKTAGLVVELKKGRENLYSLKVAKLAGAGNWLQTVTASSPVVQPEGTAPVAMASGPSPDVVAQPLPVAVLQPSSPKAPAKKRQQQAAVAISGSQDSRPLFAEKSEQLARARKEPPANQMGFDF